MKTKDMFIGVNHRNELFVDMSVDHMKTMFFKHHNRPATSNNELQAFVQQLIAKHLIKRGVVKKNNSV